MTAHRPRKFFIFYDIDGDEVGIVLRTDEYDGDEDCSWVLLEYCNTRASLKPAPRSPQPAVASPDEVNIGTGRRVLVPANFWPDFQCDEHDGRGWEAEVRSTTGLTALVRFVHARAPDGRPYRDERLALDRLLPL